MFMTEFPLPDKLMEVMRREYQATVEQQCNGVQ
jgi:hypothetical protein